MGTLLTTQEAADYLNLSKRTVLDYIREGKLEAAKIGKGWRIKEEDLEQFVEERKVTAKQE